MKGNEKEGIHSKVLTRVRFQVVLMWYFICTLSCLLFSSENHKEYENIYYSY